MNEIELLTQRVAYLENILNSLVYSDRFILQKNMQLLDGRNIQLAIGTGTKIGTGITQKLGFYNTTPIAQRASAAQAAVVTTGATNSTPWGYTTQSQAEAIVTLVNECRQALVSLGLIKGSA